MFCVYAITISLSLYILSYIGAQGIHEARFGQGIGGIFLDDVRCTGSETRLVDCPHDPSTSDCSHFEDASVICTGKIIYEKVEKLEMTPVEIAVY